MKQVITLAICLMASGMAFAQQSAATTKQTAAQRYAAAHKQAVAGYIRDARSIPITGAQVFVYMADSSATIVSSGFTDATGHYETNFTAPGKYNLKVVYPSGKAVAVNGVPVKRGVTDFTVKMNQPEADTTLPVTDFMPKAPGKKKTK